MSNLLSSEIRNANFQWLLVVRKFWGEQKLVEEILCYGVNGHVLKPVTLERNHRTGTTETIGTEPPVLFTAERDQNRRNEKF